MQNRIISNAHDINLMIARLAAQVMENYPENEDLIIVGIRRRGADLAARLAKSLEKSGKHPLLGSLDINFYRDDWTVLADNMPIIGKSDLPVLLDGHLILLVDDVLFSGRTVRAALEALFDYGRPRAVELLVLVDRGHRELPICANYVGKYIETRKDEHIDVTLVERDGEDSITLLSK